MASPGWPRPPLPATPRSFRPSSRRPTRSTPRPRSAPPCSSPRRSSSPRSCARSSPCCGPEWSSNSPPVVAGNSRPRWRRTCMCTWTTCPPTPARPRWRLRTSRRSTPLRTDRRTATEPGPPTEVAVNAAAAAAVAASRPAIRRADGRTPTAAATSRREKQMRDQRVVRCTYYLESEMEPARAAAILAGEQSSGTFVAVPGESAELHERHGAQVVDVQHLSRRSPSLPSRTHPEKVHAASVTVEWPMENIGTDLATLQTTIAGNLFELQELFACRVLDLQLPAEFIAAHPGPAFGIPGTRELIGGVDGVMIGTIVKPNVGLQPDQFRQVVRTLARASIDLIKDDELMT